MSCPIRKTTICKPFADNRLDIVGTLKSGDYILRSGANLCAQGEPSNFLYSLMSGWTAMTVLHDSGQRRVLDIRMPGAFIGIDALDLSLPVHRAVHIHGASMECVTDISVCAMSTKGFRQLLSEHAELSMRLNELAIAQSLRLQNRLGREGNIRSRSRLANFVLDTYDRASLYSPSMVRGHEMHWPLTQEMVGDALGVTSVQVCNIAKKLREDGALSLERGRLKILNRSLLEDIGLYESDPRQLMP